MKLPHRPEVLSCLALLVGCLGGPVDEQATTTAEAITAAPRMPVVVHFLWDALDAQGKPRATLSSWSSIDIHGVDASIGSRSNATATFVRTAVHYVHDDGVTPCAQLLTEAPMPGAQRAVHLFVTGRCASGVAVGGNVVLENSPAAVWDAIPRASIPLLRSASLTVVTADVRPLAQGPVEFRFPVHGLGGRVMSLALTLHGTSSIAGNFAPYPSTRLTLISPWGRTVQIPWDATRVVPYEVSDPEIPSINLTPWTDFNEGWSLADSFVAPLRGFRPDGVWRLRVEDPNHYAVLGRATLHVAIGPSTYASDRFGVGSPDLLAYRRGIGVVSALNRRPQASDFAAETITPAKVPRVATARATDLDGDGATDLVYVCTDLRVRTTLAREDHQIQRFARIAGEIVNDLDHLVALAGDLDGDGLGDLLISNDSSAALPGSWRAHPGLGNGSFGAPAPVTLAGPTAPYAVNGQFMLADSNRDGRADLVVRDVVTGRSYFAWNSAASAAGVAFASPSAVTIGNSLTTSYSNHDLRLIDVDVDGREDLVVRQRDTLAWSFHRQLSSTSFAAALPLAIHGATTGFAAPDLLLP